MDMLARPWYDPLMPSSHDYERVLDRARLRETHEGPWHHQGEHLDSIVAPETLMLVHGDGRTILLADDLLGLARDTATLRPGIHLLHDREALVDTVGQLVSWINGQPWSDGPASTTHCAWWTTLDGPVRLHVERATGGGRFDSVDVDVRTLLDCACNRRSLLDALLRDPTSRRGLSGLTMSLYAPRTRERRTDR